MEALHSPPAPPPHKQLQDPAKGVVDAGSKGRAAEQASTDAVSQEFNNVHLLRYFTEKAWRLPSPDVIITVNGGAKHFDLSAEHKDTIMRGMMEGTRHLNPWCVLPHVLCSGHQLLWRELGFRIWDAGSGLC